MPDDTLLDPLPHCFAELREAWDHSPEMLTDFLLAQWIRSRAAERVTMGALALLTMQVNRKDFGGVLEVLTAQQQAAQQSLLDAIARLDPPLAARLEPLMR